MVDEPHCQFSKYGFCRFRETCKRKHYNEIRKDSSGCQQIQTCQRRHPKPCKRFASGEHTEKIDMLEKIVWEITPKFIQVDQELKDLKKQINLQAPVNNEVDQIKETEDEIEPPKCGDNDKGVIVKSIETFQNKSQGADISSLEIKQDKIKENQTEVWKSQSRDSLLKCHKCDYDCKKNPKL